jgi:hypothetical protein
VSRVKPATAPKPSLGNRLEGLVLVLILLTVAGFAGSASFTHVKTWTLDNSPAGTPEWFGLANAVISELVPTACALVIRRRRGQGLGIGYPMGLLLAAVALSLAAQFAVAIPSVSGWLLSAVPALAFVALTKLVLSTAPTPPHSPETAGQLEAEEIDLPSDPAPTGTRIAPSAAAERVLPVQPENASPAPEMPEPLPAPLAPTAVLVPSRVNGHVITSGVVR